MATDFLTLVSDLETCADAIRNTFCIAVEMRDQHTIEIDCISVVLCDQLDSIVKQLAEVQHG